MRKVTDLKPLARGDTRSGLNLSPDGQWLAVCGFDGKQRGVFLIPTAGGQPQLLEEVGRQDSVLPMWSPDGNWLAYTLGQQLIRKSRDGQVRETLATLPIWQSWSVRWSPDGTRIASFGDTTTNLKPAETENSSVYVVTVADKTVRKITADTETQWKEGLEWHPSGEYLAYIFNGPERFSAQIRRAWVDGRPTDLMIQQTNHSDYVGVWAPDGKRYFFTSSAQNEKSIHLYDAQTKQITHGLWDGRMNALSRWSRDGRAAVWAIGGTLRYFEVIEDFPK